MATWTSYKTYVFSNNPPWGIDGIGGTLDSANSNSGTRIYNNSDGTRTILIGTGIGGSGDGPTWTTLSSVRHVASDNTLIEEITGITATSAPAGHFFSGGILSGDDTFVGSSGADRFYGQGGNNTVQGSGGADEIHTGGGNDTFRLQAGDFVAGETIDAGGGTDTIQLENAGSVDLSAGTISSVEILKYFSGTSVVTASALQFAGSANGGAAALTTIVGSSSVDSLTFKNVSSLNFSGLTFTSWTPGQDTITYLVQGPGNFGSIVATSQNETFQLVGDGGNISSGGGDDTFVFNGSSFHGGISLDGGTGTNVIQLNNATVDYTSDQGTSLTNIQQIQYTSGNSTFTVSGKTLAGAMPHTIIGSAGVDKFVVNTVIGHADLSGIVFNSWTDGTDSVVIDGRTGGSSQITGSSQADTIYGFTGYNYAGHDTISGGGGSDTIVIGTGFEALTGGSGADHFAFFGIQGSGYVSNATITDFTVSGTNHDILDLTALGPARTFGSVLASAMQNGPDTVINLGNGGSVTLQNVNKAALTVDDFAGLRTTVSDISHDGTSDIVFRNNATGDTGYTDIRNLTYHAIGGSPPSYSIAGLGDFNGDGYTDLLFRNNSTGDTGYTDVHTLTYHSLGVAPPNLSVVGTGDYNGDGYSDILFRNNATGDTGYTDVRNSTYHSLGNAPPNLSVVGSGDYNGDGYSDILFRNTSTGDIGYTDVRTSTYHNLGNAPTSLSVVGSGDYNGDGYSDILFRNTATGDTGYTDVKALAYHSLGTAPPALSVVGSGDYNGDGYSDILFRNNTTGDTGYTDVHQLVYHSLGSSPSDYSVIV